MRRHRASMARPNDRASVGLPSSPLPRFSPIRCGGGESRLQRMRRPARKIRQLTERREQRNKRYSFYLGLYRESQLTIIPFVLNLSKGELLSGQRLAWLALTPRSNLAA